MRYSTLIYSTLVMTLVADALRLLINMGVVGGGATELIASVFIYASILIFSYLPFSKEAKLSKNVKIIYYIWLLCCILNMIRGAILADDYYDYKWLLIDSVGFTFIALTFFIGSNIAYSLKIIKFTIRYGFIFGFFLIPLQYISAPELYARLMSPVSFFIILIPYLKNKWKFLIIMVAVLSILTALSNRTGIIKITFSFLILSIFYLRKYMPKIILLLFYFMFFIAPIILTILGLTGRYNIFIEMSKNETYETEGFHGNQESLSADTRTFLYAEVLQSVKNSGNWIIGESSTGSYKSNWFGFDRNASEVGILNIFLYYGLIGVLIYLILLFTLSFRIITKSNNLLFKMGGLLIASRWFLSFIEEFTQFDINFYFFWFFMGFLSISKFQKLNDQSLKYILKQI